MKKIPQPEDQVQPATEPMLPGTETPRSLGDMLREAEQAQQRDADTRTGDTAETGDTAVAARDAPSGRARRGNRAQARRYARERALQALYQWDLGQSQSSEVRRQFLDTQDMSRVDVDYFSLLFKGVSHDPETVDAALANALDRPIADLDPIERAVLRVATYELMECQDIPARVVINEGIEVTKRFGADKGHRYVNGVLDKVAAAVRPLEMRRR